MFTGIIERTGKVISFTSAQTPEGGLVSSISQLIVDCGNDYETKLGDSVALNGCCLSVTNNKGGLLAFDVSRETIAVTNLKHVEAGDEINLERAMILGSRLDGHIVSGHVDGVATVDGVKKQADGWDLWISVPRKFSPFVISKGSITLNGVSLTINALIDEAEVTRINLMLIPITVTSVTSIHTSFLPVKMSARSLVFRSIFAWNTPWTRGTSGIVDAGPTWLPPVAAWKNLTSRVTGPNAGAPVESVMRPL
jgi:riboflavin synthase